MKKKILIPIILTSLVILVGISLLLYFIVFQNNASIPSSTAKSTTPLPTALPSTTPVPSTTTPPPSTTTPPPSTKTPPPSTKTPPTSTTPPPLPTSYTLDTDGTTIQGGNNVTYTSNTSIKNTVWTGQYTNCTFSVMLEEFMFSGSCTDCIFDGTFVSGTIGMGCDGTRQNLKNCEFSGIFGDSSDVMLHVDFAGDFTNCSFENMKNTLLSGKFTDCPDLYSQPIDTNLTLQSMSGIQFTTPNISCIQFEGNMYMYTQPNDSILRLQGNQNYFEFYMTSYGHDYQIIGVNTEKKSFYFVKNDGSYGVNTYTDTPPIEIPDESTIPSPNYENVDQLDIGQSGAFIKPFEAQGFLQFYLNSISYVNFVLNKTSVALKYDFFICAVGNNFFMR